MLNGICSKDILNISINAQGTNCKFRFIKKNIVEIRPYYENKEHIKFIPLENTSYYSTSSSTTSLMSDKSSDSELTNKSINFYGNGKLYVNGSLIYIGFLYKSMYHGKGKLYYNNGILQYYGDWKKGLRHGVGIEYNLDTSIKYAGIWIEDIFIK